MKRVEIKIPCGEIMKNIATWSYTIGELVPDEQAKQRHFIQGATDFGHVSLIKDALDMAWVDMLDALSAYMVNGCDCGCDAESCDCGNDDGSMTEYELQGEPFELHDYCATLYFPDDTYPNLGYKISTTVKQYILMKCRAQWETILGRDPSMSEAAAEKARARLKVTITTRIPIGHTQSEWSNFIKF